MLVGCQGVITAYGAGFVSCFPFDVIFSSKFVFATRRHRHRELPQQRQLIPVTRPLNTLRSLGDDEENGYDYSNANHHRKIVDGIGDREGSHIPKIKAGQREQWTLVKEAKGGRDRDSNNTTRHAGAGRSTRYRSRLGEGSRELQHRSVGRGSRGISRTGSRMGGARDRERRGRGRSRPDAEAVSVGIQMG